MNDRRVHVIGAGPAGLTAAINLARSGYEVIVHEQKKEIGWRFNGDYQGIENWSTKEDALNILETMGIFANFRCEPCYHTDFYGPDLSKVTLQTKRPLYYLVERGTNEWTLDQGLKRIAQAEGVNLRLGEKMEYLPAGWVIVATGPKAADAIAKGIVFRTSHSDLCAGFLDNRIAPKAYAYLLVNNQKATFATCLFEDFSQEKLYFQRALECMKKVIEIDIHEPREFGGYVNFFLNGSRSRHGRVLFAGENAGFQDALWGFGLRYAMLSGYLAAVSIRTGLFYDELCDRHIKPYLETSLVNRWLFSLLGNWGYQLILRKMRNDADPMKTLLRHCQPSFLKSLLFQIVKRSYATRLVNKQCMHQDCDCVWCRHCKKNDQLPILKPAQD